MAEDRCSAHGLPLAAHHGRDCARPSYRCECAMFPETGMHWDTCPGRAREGLRGPTLRQRLNRHRWDKFGYWPRPTVVKEPILRAYRWLAIIPYDDGRQIEIMRCRTQADAIAKIEEEYRTYVPARTQP